jgi:hypothetical protein
MNLRCSISVPGILKAATWAEAWLADAPDRPNPTSLKRDLTRNTDSGT